MVQSPKRQTATKNKTQKIFYFKTPQRRGAETLRKNKTRKSLGNSEPTSYSSMLNESHWIPAYAGMTALRRRYK
jgi:hypothetical protein